MNLWIRKSNRTAWRFKTVFLFGLLLGLFGCIDATPSIERIDEDFNFGWRFHLGDLSEASTAGFPDTDWRAVRLPHDWSVEHSFTQENTAGATAYLPGGVGWYRKHFHVSSESLGRRISIEFDGVYTDSQVWVNGHLLGKRPNGYTAFSYDLSEYLKYGEDNVIAVRADRSAYIDCRWYPGSGIYRDVRLVSRHATHIPKWGVFVSTPSVSAEKATVSVQTDLINSGDDSRALTLETELYFEGARKAKTRTSFNLAADESMKVEQSLELDSPELWDLDSPNLYLAVSRVYAGSELIDTEETSFGVRSFRFDRDTGFYLNGKNVPLKGVCLHHDGGLVGAAVPDGVWERRLKTLKAAGCNAIRTAHNPPSAAFLDLCDELGFVVQDEAFDEWNNPKDKKHNYGQQEADPLTTGYTEYFSEWSQRDLQAMVLRDRNHPSIVMWSIGNEIEWTYPGYEKATGYWGDTKKGDVNYYWDEPPYSIDEIKELYANADKGDYDLASTAQELADWVRDIDTTRPVTANLVIPSVSNFSGYAAALDIVGLSYRQSVYDYVRRHYPDLTILGTENWARYHEWEYAADRDFVSGILIWTGIDYMGESREWPRRGSTSGLLDFAGFEKPSYHMYKTLWSDDPHIYITTQTVEASPYKWDASEQQLVEKEENWAARQKWGWHDVNEHWDYTDGEVVAVEVYTNQPAVELFLNGETQGIQKLDTQTDHILKWQVPYAKGELVAKAVDASSDATLRSAGAFAGIEIKVDKDKLKANAYDVSHFTIQLVDAAGTPVRTDDREVVFEIEGPARLLGVDNGLVDSVQDYQSKRLVTGNGKALMILQSTKIAGEVRVTVRSGDVSSNSITLQVK